MKNELFLAKIKNSDERDVVKYIEFTGFECDHYFGGLHIKGACFCGFEKELRDLVENNFGELETILTKDDFIKLFELNDELKTLGYGINKDSDKYNKGIEIIKEYENTIEKKLKSNENKNKTKIRHQIIKKITIILVQNIGNIRKLTLNNIEN